MAEWGWRTHIRGIAHGLSMYPNTYSLVHAAAAMERAAVNITFSNSSQRITKSFPFFPSFFLPRTSTNPFHSLLNQPSFPKFQLIEHAHSTQLIARDFSELKKMAFILFQQTGYLPLLIETERQFLLTQKWKYFQSFDAQLNPLHYSFSNTRMEGLAENLHETLKSLHTHNSKMEQEWMERISAAHTLLYSPAQRLLSLQEKIEMHLDNQLFLQQLAVPIETTAPANTSNWNVEKREKMKKMVLQSPLAGEGKCNCCKPQSLLEAHVYEEGIVPFTITQDGVYIHTQNQSLSEEYHSTHTGKEKREARAKEYGLNTFPIGPLWRNETISLPLNEATHEMENGNGQIKNDFSRVHWKCMHHAPAITHATAQLQELIQFHCQQKNALLQPYMNQYQLYYTQFAHQDPAIQLHSHAQKLTEQLQENMAWHLIRGETKWRNATPASPTNS